MNESLTIKDHLIRAKQLILNPVNWNKGDYFKKDANGKRDINCMCALGAIRRSYQESNSITVGASFGSTDHTGAAVHLGRTVRIHSKFTAVSKFNDGMKTSHNDMLRMFDLAIKSAPS